MRLQTITILLLLPLTSLASTGFSTVRATARSERPARPASDMVEVECGEAEDIYENHAGEDLCVTLRVMDQCEIFDSTVTVTDEDGHDVGGMEVPDLGTKTGSFRVPDGGKINLDCEGTTDEEDEGCCKYDIEVETFCELVLERDVSSLR